MKKSIIFSMMILLAISVFGQKLTKKRATHYKKVKNVDQCYLGLKEHQFGTDSVVASPLQEIWPEYCFQNDVENFAELNLSTLSVICLSKANYYLGNETDFSLPTGQFENVCVLIPGSKQFYLAPNQLIEIFRITEKFEKQWGLEKVLRGFPEDLKRHLYFAMPGKMIYNRRG